MVEIGADKWLKGGSSSSSSSSSSSTSSVVVDNTTLTSTPFLCNWPFRVKTK